MFLRLTFQCCTMKRRGVCVCVKNKQKNMMPVFPATFTHYFFSPLIAQSGFLI